jgi:hypothetical protein
MEASARPKGATHRFLTAQVPCCANKGNSLLDLRRPFHQDRAEIQGSSVRRAAALNMIGRLRIALK